jgi:hypothetical protein
MLPSSGHNCMLSWPLPPARDFSAGISPLGRGDSNIERLPPGLTTSKGGMNVCCIRQLFMSCKGKELPQSKQRDLMKSMTSACGSCDCSPRHHRHPARLYWRSRHRITAVVCNPGSCTRRRRTGGNKAATWAPSIAQVRQKMQNCL